MARYARQHAAYHRPLFGPMTHDSPILLYRAFGTGKLPLLDPIRMPDEFLSDIRTSIARYPRLLPYSALVLAALAWAGNAVVGRGIRESYDPLELTFYRWSIACLCLYLVSGKAIHAEFHQARRNILSLLTGAVFGMAGFHFLQYFALARLPASDVAVVVGMTPITVTVAQVVIHRALPAPGITLGIGLGTCGVFLVCWRAGQITFAGGPPWAGIGAATAAMLCWSAYSMRSNQCEGMSWLGTLFYMSLASTAILLPFYVFDVVTSRTHVPNLKLLIQILYLGIPASVIAYALYDFGIRGVGALRAAQFNCLIPAFAGVLAVVLLDESMTRIQFFGLMLVTLALHLIIFVKRHRAPR